MLLWTSVAVAVAAPTHAQMDSASWSQVTTASHADAGTVTIWSASVGGIDCFRGTAVTEVGPDKLLSVVADVEGARTWSSAGISEAKLLSKSGNKLEYYQYLDVPSWTMSSDRFWFLQSTLESGAERAALQWSPLVNGGAHAAYYAEVKAAHPDAVEPSANVGSWVFERRSDGTHVTYSVCTLPGGSIPTMVQNAATRKTLPDTVGDAVRAARKR
jgi:hypothetical protein